MTSYPKTHCLRFVALDSNDLITVLWTLKRFHEESGRTRLPCNQVVLNIPRGFDHTLIGHSFSPSSSQLCMAPRAPVIVRNIDGCCLVGGLCWQPARGLKCSHSGRSAF